MKTAFIALSAAALAASVSHAGAPFEIGMARYTMHKQGYQKSLEVQKLLDCRKMGLMEGSIPRDASPEEIAAFKKHAAEYGVEIVTAGPLYFSDAESVEALFKFASNFGLKSVSVVPFEWNPKIENVKDPQERRKLLPPSEWKLESERAMDMLEACVKKYGIRAAVHNHGPDNAYLYPTAEAALKRIGGRDRRIGVCLDVGHERRAGLDPVEFIRRHGDRVVEVHLKNIIIDPVKNLAMPGPRGELDIPGILGALWDIGFSGPCLVEYERDFDDNTVPLAESFGYYRGVMDALGKCRK